jgi:excisionase family DNA binding protein
VAKHTHSELEQRGIGPEGNSDEIVVNGGLPRRLMTAFEVAEFVGCHEETIRRAYLRGLLTSQRFGVRGRRFHPADVRDWIQRGAPTRVS